MRHSVLLQQLKYFTYNLHAFGIVVRLKLRRENIVLTVAKKNSSFLFDEFYQDIEYSKNDLAFGTITSEMIMQSYYIRNFF